MSLGARFESERERLSLSRSQLAARAEVTPVQIGRIERDQSKPGAEILSALCSAGGDVAYVLIGTRTYVDRQRLAWICHAIEAAVEEQLQVKGHANPELLGLIYNKVLSRGRGPDDDVELAKGEVTTYLESLRVADIPEHELAKRLLRIDQAKPLPLSAASSGISVTGDGNQVAGGSIHAAPKITKQK